MTLVINQANAISNTDFMVTQMFTKTSDEFFKEVCEILYKRAEIYSHPYPNHKRIAELWTAYLEHPITPFQVSVMQILVKISRIVETPGHYDSLLDIAGYARVANMIDEVMRGNDADRQEF